MGVKGYHAAIQVVDELDEMGWQDEASNPLGDVMYWKDRLRRGGQATPDQVIRGLRKRGFHMPEQVQHLDSPEAVQQWCDRMTAIVSLAPWTA